MGKKECAVAVTLINVAENKEYAFAVTSTLLMLLHFVESYVTLTFEDNLVNHFS